MPENEKAAPAQAVKFSWAIRGAFPVLKGPFDLFESEIEAWERRFKKASAAARWPEEELQATGVRTAHRQVSHLFAPVALRIVDLAEGVVTLVNAELLHPTFPVSRAVIETAAVPAYVVREVVPRIAKGRTEQTEETLRRLIVGMDPGVELGGEIQPIRIGKIIDSLKSYMDQLDEASEVDGGFGRVMRRFYSYVTDHSHPNMSALHLSSTVNGDFRPMTWNRSGGWDAFALEMAVGAAYLAMWAGGQAFDDALRGSQQNRLVLSRRTS